MVDHDLKLSMHSSTISATRNKMGQPFHQRLNGGTYNGAVTARTINDDSARIP